MNISDPQFFYMAFVLPSLFGLILVAEGLNRILREEGQAWLSLVLGMLFIGVIVFAYFFLLQSPS